MWPFRRKPPSAFPPRISLVNTRSGAKEIFVPLKAGVALLYSCGPTVYSRAHIGNLRAYVFSDTLARTLSAAGYRVRRVINITDVGHLVADADEGEDKMTLAARKEHERPEAIALRYTRIFLEDLRELGVDTDDIRFPRATEYIREQIALAETLEQKGFAYRTPAGLYFDTARFPGYGALGNLAGAELLEGARVPSRDKRHATDFALWRLAQQGDLQQWESPWGRGNPGWHLECSAMSRVLLASEIDIHTGGEDHIAVHHNNEIAQSEAASGRPFVRYWMHGAFLSVNHEKISKSLGNDIYLSDILARGINPRALRYFYLQAHYRTPLSFSWGALEAAENALARLGRTAEGIAREAGRASAPSEARERFLAAMRDDLATPQALRVLWETVKSEEYAPEEKWGLIESAETHLALGLLEAERAALIPSPEVAALLEEREAARRASDFVRADRLRGEIEKSGYRVEDGPEGPVLTRHAL